MSVPRPARERALNALTTYYRCRDDRWLILTILNEDVSVAKRVGTPVRVLDGGMTYGTLAMDSYLFGAPTL